MRLQRENVPFTMVANEVLARVDLSWKAKGLYAYLFSKPDEWDFSSNRIKNEGADGRSAVLSALKELEKVGLLSRTRQGDGRMVYLLKHAIQSPKTGPRLFDARAAKKVVDDTRAVVMAEKAPVNDLIAMFEPCNPSFDRLYSNRTQRSVLERMAKKYGVEKLSGTIKFACSVQGLPYAPTITTPYDLEKNLGKLIVYSKRQKAKGPMLVNL